MSRGRGGRGGRGGSANKSFTRDQLNDLGVGNKDALPSLVTQPPSLYPPLERKPVPFTPSLETDYMLILRRDFIDHMQLSSSYIKIPLASKSNQPEQQIDKLVAQIHSTKEKYDWNLFPSELRPKLLAKRIKKGLGQKPDVNIQERLNALEKLEQSKNAVVIKEEAEDEPEEEMEAEENEPDEEMDEGTDYANNYFDNGENYEDEDDNLDEGPIY